MSRSVPRRLAVAASATAVALAAVVGVNVAAGSASASTTSAKALATAKATAAKEIAAKRAAYDKVAFAMPYRDLSGGSRQYNEVDARRVEPLGAALAPLTKAVATDRAALASYATSVSRATTVTAVTAVRTKVAAYNPNNYLTAESLLMSTESMRFWVGDARTQFTGRLPDLRAKTTPGTDTEANRMLRNFEDLIARANTALPPLSAASVKAQQIKGTTPAATVAAVTASVKAATATGAALTEDADALWMEYYVSGLMP